MSSHNLSHITLDSLDLHGYSVAGEESVIGIPQLDVCFDIGKAPDQIIPIQNVLLTHGHMDHAAGIAYYLSHRNFLKMTPGVVLTPPNTIDPLNQIIQAWGRLDGSRIPAKLVPMRPGEEYKVKPNLFVRAFPTKHTRESIGFSVIERRKKLKPEYHNLSGPELVQLKKKGVSIDSPLEIPIVTYLGDTSYVDFSQLDYVANSQILIAECTFFEDEHTDRADAGRHMHIDEFGPLLERMNNQYIVITHLTQRTTVGQAKAMLRKKLPSEVFRKIHILMDRKYRQVDNGKVLQQPTDDPSQS
ncbi:MAG: MBL fold metallo-hydrolase [Sedimentisphaerales bacterium]|nr:MBL fold metallo-hydrolase [Sedimentisphaerales bacterium]